MTRGRLNTASTRNVAASDRRPRGSVGSAINGEGTAAHVSMGLLDTCVDEVVREILQMTDLATIRAVRSVDKRLMRLGREVVHSPLWSKAHLSELVRALWSEACYSVCEVFEPTDFATSKAVRSISLRGPLLGVAHAAGTVPKVYCNCTYPCTSQLLVGCVSAGPVQLFDTSSMALIQTIGGAAGSSSSLGPVTRVALGAASLACASRSNVHIFGAEQTAAGAASGFAHTSLLLEGQGKRGVRALAWLGNTQTLVSGADDHSVRLWSMYR